MVKKKKLYNVYISLCQKIKEFKIKNALKLL